MTERKAVPEASERQALVKKIEVVYRGEFDLERAVVDQPTGDGGRRTIVRLSLERGDSAAVVVVDRSRRAVWLAEQFRYSTLRHGLGWTVETPAGGVEEDEEPAEAARREMLAETGIEARELERIATFYTSPGGTSERVFLYYAPVDNAEPDLEVARQHRDPDEDIKLERWTLDEFLEAARLGQIDDAKTLIAGLWLLANRERLKI